MKLFVAAIATGLALTTSPSGVPIATAPAATVSNDRYDAFATSVPVAGGILTAYRHGNAHASADGKVRLRRSHDGRAWSDYYELPTPPGNAWAPTGMTVDTGGRIYLATVRDTSTGPETATNFWPFLWISDDDGHTWVGPTALPSPRDGWTYPHGLTVTSAGSIILGEYVKSATTSRWEAWYHASPDRGLTWTPFGTVAIPGRDAYEPAVTPLADGSIMSIIRSDAPGVYYDYFYCAHTMSPARPTAQPIWSTPAVCIVHATGAPGISHTAGGIVVTYRGYETLPEDATNQRYPLRAAVFDEDGVGLRGNIDPNPGDERRYLYGNIVNNNLIYGAESTQGTSAGVYSLPIQLPAVPAY